MLTVIRGLPGSGKTKLGELFVSLADNTVLLEADQFFLKNGEYEFDGSRLTDAHAWCLQEAERHLQAGTSPVVANTFVKIQEMLPYWKLALKYQHKVYVAEPSTHWAKDPEQCFDYCLHGVPLATIQRRHLEWESFPLGSLTVERLEQLIHFYSG